MTPLWLVLLAALVLAAVVVDQRLTVVGVHQANLNVSVPMSIQVPQVKMHAAPIRSEAPVAPGAPAIEAIPPARTAPVQVTVPPSSQGCLFGTMPPNSKSEIRGGCPVD